MNIFIIRRADFAFGQYKGFVIAAPNEAAARQEAKELSLDDRCGNADLWLDLDKVSCKKVDLDGIDRPTLILSDYVHSL